MGRSADGLRRVLHLARWLANTLVVLIGLSVISFALTALVPGDLAEHLLTSQGVVPTDQMVAELRHQKGLDRPVWQQYLDWLVRVCHGDLGTSLAKGTRISADFAQRLPLTMALTLTSLVIMWAIAIPVGLYIAARPHSWSDRLIRLLSYLSSAVPGFVVALGVLYVLGMRMHWFPIAATQDLRGMVMPLITMVLAMTGWYVRQVRAIAVEELDKPYVSGLRMHGMNESRVARHVLRNILAPLCTLTGTSVGGLLAGSAVIETLFSWQGLGHYALAAIQAKDYPVIQAYVLWCAIAFLVANALADLAAVVVDPRLGTWRMRRHVARSISQNTSGDARLAIEHPDLARLARRRRRTGLPARSLLRLSSRLQWWLLLVLLALFFAAGAGARWLTPFDPFQPRPDAALQPPGGEHLLGTDDLGRDLLARVLVGIVPTASLALAVAMCSLVIGTAVGVLAALAGGWVDALLQRITAVFQSFPEFILAMSVAAMMGSGFTSVMLALTAAYWTGIARYARILTLSVRQAPYVQVARMNGVPEVVVVLRHLVPNIVTPLLVITASHMGGVVLNLATLSFVGLGLPQPTSEWGTMISSARDYIQVAPWLVAAPGVTLFLLILLCNLFADTTQQRMSVNSPSPTKKRIDDNVYEDGLLPAGGAPAARRLQQPVA